MKKKKAKSIELEGLAKEIGMRRPFDMLERELFLNLARTFSILSDQLQEIIKAQGLTGPQYNVLRILRGHGKAVSVYQIAEQMIARQPDMPRLIDRLVKLGFVEKQRCDQDRRVIWVTLTREGKSILRRIDAPLAAKHKEQFQHMSVTQMKKLNDLLWLAVHPQDLD